MRHFEGKSVSCQRFNSTINVICFWLFLGFSLKQFYSYPVTWQTCKRIQEWKLFTAERAEILLWRWPPPNVSSLTSLYLLLHTYLRINVIEFHEALQYNTSWGHLFHRRCSISSDIKIPCRSKAQSGPCKKIGHSISHYGKVHYPTKQSCGR